MKKFLLVLACIGFIATNYAQESLPSVSIENVNGEKVNIQDFAKNGKITIISFWATWCKPCQKELNTISEVYEDWQDEYNCELVAVSIDDSRDAPKVKPYASGQGWEYEVLLDKNQELKRALNFRSVPYVIIVDANGNIVYKHSGYQDGDEEELEAKLKELSAS